ncbi:uncharacterized protein [Diadema antillarum]|uniref:uncharacterized protein n=1 Tax=Diadema antillarum TaxID=105358 RepID=UPI003A8C6E56
MGGGDERGLGMAAHGQEETDGVGSILGRVAENIGDIVENISDIVDTGENGARRFLQPFTFPLSSLSEAANEEEVGNTVFVSGRSIPRRFGVHLVREAEGHKIAKVFDQSLAHHAQLRESDIITHLNGVELGSKNIIKVHELFLDVETKLTLKILREVEICGNFELVEHEITITIDIESGGHVIGVRILPVTVTYYIAQDHHNESQVFMQSNARTGRLAMRAQRGEFELVPVACFLSRPVSTLYVLRNASSKEAFSSATIKMEPFDESAIEDFLLDITKFENNRYVFRRAECKRRQREQAQGGHFLNNVDGEITLTYFDRPTRVLPSGVFELIEANHV